MPMSRKTEKIIRKAIEAMHEEGFDLFGIGLSREGEVAIIKPESCTPEDVMHNLAAFVELTREQPKIHHA